MTLKSSLRGAQTDVGDPIFPEALFDLIQWIVYGWIQYQVPDSFLPLGSHSLYLIFLLSLASFHLRIVTAEISGMISLRLAMEDSNAIGYCSSFKMELSSTD